MSRYVGIVRAVALLTVAGCLRGSLLAPARAAPSTQIVSASVNVISETLQQGLCDVGILAREKREHGEALLVGATGTGKVFSLRVRPEKPEQPEGRPRTAVTLVWDGEADEAFWGTVLQILAPAIP